MATLRAIRRRIQSVRNIQQITRAMYMVSAAKLRRAQQEVESARPYAETLEELISNVLFRMRVSGEEGEAHPLLEEREVRRAEVLLFSSDRGLCGAFNTNLIRTAQDFIAENSGSIPEITLSLVGKKALDYFRRRKQAMRKTYLDWERNLSFELARQVADELIERYQSADLDAVYLIYSFFQSPIVQRPKTTRLLPFPRKEPTLELVPVDYIYEPSPDVLLNELLPRQARMQVFRALLETRASEHAARMNSMDQATNNCVEMIDQLTLKMNRARQESITKELLEIIVGAEALKE
jgi:F-type H+-transporting ATPase subunit gamma